MTETKAERLQLLFVVCRLDHVKRKKAFIPRKSFERHINKEIALPSSHSPSLSHSHAI